MNGVPLVGQQQLALAPCPASAPHITARDGSDQVTLCRFCGGYGMVLVNPRVLKILDIRDDKDAARESDSVEAQAH